MGRAQGQEPGIPQVLEELIDDSPVTYRKELIEIYDDRQYEPLWVSLSDHLNAEGQALYKILSEAERLGLNSKDYAYSELHWLQRTDQLFSEDRPLFHTNVLARIEVVLTNNLVKLLDHVTSGRLSPEQVNGKWYLEDERPPLTQIVTQVIDDGIAVTLESLAGGHEGYGPLLKTLVQYLQIKSDGGWPIIPGGPLLTKGTSSPRVKVLRQRLAATGDMNDGPISSVFDQKVMEGVEKFQARHGLSVDGIVGPRTLETLNTPVDSRIRQLLVNLERRRWMPRTLGPDYVLVNIPDFQLTAYQDGKPQMGMPVIVGKPMSQTPIFSDILEYLVLNPYWNVPRSIVIDEIIPKFQEDPAYLEESNFELVDWDEQPMEISQLTLENIEAGTIRIRQKPGPNNALGLVKFMFPNDHAIYLHDTPADHLFDASERDFSHGCIRVERPTDLAAFLLNGKWSREEILHTIESSERRAIQLPQAIPVYILYLTAWVAEDGTLQFREDLYGHDEQLWTALQPVLSTAGGRSNQSI
ncbi:L,D-transpeptidase family protein [Candidatus Nitrospira allomarina]|uniref:L,D-transpeptidase family protein n=1 Tax=Candidatus Nitrospira allomarina TaxID=3020900 RepID=A0AA96JQL6_9BACT|nr:L,D-transpeptidase family protein [Candidatus Nitrospira allomarina]WNM56577.1 L,D-transpeptidase family protein [Candidatus Nitrospira allomarina]